MQWVSKQHLLPQIKELYNKGVLYEDICEQLNISNTFVKKSVNKMIANGELQKRKKKYRLKQKPVVKKVTKCVSKPDYEDYPELEHGVNCTREVSAQCIYGFPLDQHSNYLCNYCDIMKHTRGGDPKCCTKFVKITEETPRRYSEYDNGYRFGTHNK